MKPWLAPLLAALVLTLLNAAKPLVVDDDAYYQFARQVAEHPLDVYGFEAFWGGQIEPANHVLAPPLLLHWWGAAIALFGDSVVAWKLSLFPFALTLGWALLVLARRFAPGLEAPVVWLGVLSPTVVPALNLMLDVPALALGLAALAIFVRADAEERTALAAFAGVVAGLALQTKYNQVTLVAALGVYTLLQRRLAYGIIAAAAATAVFVGWEASVAWRYGDSHFLFALGRQQADAPVATAKHWIVSFLTLLGASAGGLGLLSLLAAGARARGLAVAAAFVVAVFLTLTQLPPTVEARFELSPNLALPRIELWLFGVLGLGVLAAGSGAGRRLLGDADGRFLLAWLVIEVVGVFVLSPFMALRRIIGLHAVWLLAAARAASIGAAPLVLVRGVALFGCALGLLYGVADLTDARARQAVFGEAVAGLEERGVDSADGHVWFLGVWGPKFLAEREGMRPVVAEESQLAVGDWLLVPTGVLRQLAAFPPGSRGERGVYSVRGSFPWSTLPNSYAGAIPIQGQPQIQMQITLQQLLSDVVPVVPPERD